MMRCHTMMGCVVWLFSVFSALAADKPVLPPAAKKAVDFQHDIAPLFARSCHSCHGAAKQRGGLRLDAATEAAKGGNSGPAFKPGDAAGSRLLQLVAGLDAETKMPPTGKGLTPVEIGLVRAWIEQGAKWAPIATPTATAATTSSHWAFQPVRRPALPTVVNNAGVRNDIDRFILARLEKEKIAPAPEADRATLIRRLSLDLLGLPPERAEVEAFIQDPRADAYERLVDRLLASPHYGERWARHWLDMARYADSDGYEKDTGRPFAWRYRQWVIEALNRNEPYDQFLVDQLAGDLLPQATLEQKIATGFHRNTLTNREGGVDQEQFRVEAVVDRVNTTGKVLLGVTIGCCQCHDHKYDPLTQREFYQLFAFFNSDQEVNLPAPRPGEMEVYAKKKPEFDKKRAELDAKIAAYRKNELPIATKKWESELKVAELRRLPQGIRDLLLIEPVKRDDKQQADLNEYYYKTDPKREQLNKELAVLDRTAPQLSQAQTLALGAKRKTHVLIRGDFLRPGVAVEPATPAVLPPMSSTGAPTRLDFARWLVAPANPLTSRVAVNWVWQRYFGRGLVFTLEDFGTQGERPSHPELLDWLASEFVHSGWNVKGLHRLIVTSATYRQSSKTSPELVARDPLNILLARQSRLRLEAEVVRDVALAASGLLQPAVGGPSVRPPQPAGISELTYAGSAKWIESSGSDRYRRGLYTWFQRTSPYPMLMTFDAPDSNVCCVRRDRSNTPLQALTLLNDTVFVECAQALARRVLKESSDGSERLRHAFRLCLAREPTAAELTVLSRLHGELLQASKAKPAESAKLVGSLPSKTDPAEAAAWVALARAMLNLDEFVTRE
jgi:mono/diheme cytochrome c family protein